MNVLIAVLAVAGCGLTPPEAVAAARRDVERLPSTARHVTRYLTLGEVDGKRRPELVRVLSGHVNHLSREQDLVPLQLVDGAGGALLRLNLDDYRWSRDVWESLAKSDPYFHVTVVEPWPGGVWPPDGKPYPAGSFPWKHAALSPWLAEGPAAKEHLAALVAATRSEVPIVRGDWFLNQTAAQAERKPGYYDFLEVKTQRDFEVLAGFDRKIADQAGRVDREAVAQSGVSLQPRAVVREEGLRPIWKTFDFKRAVDRRNPLRVLGKDIEKNHDATEQFGGLRNGLWATWLANGAGDRQDFAPPDIASDHASKSNDKRVHVNVSCLRCHVDSGLQPIDGWVRNVFAGSLTFEGFDEKAHRENRQQYFSKIGRYLDRDRRVYADAIKEITRWTPKEWATKYGAEWERYEDARVDLAWAARDLHVTVVELQAAIDRAAKAKAVADRTGPAEITVKGTLDIVVGALAEGETVGIRQWEEAYPVAQLMLRGAVP